MTHRITELQEQIAELQRLKSQEIQKLCTIDTSKMSKKELIAHAMTLPDIPDHLWNDMQRYGFVTGSSVFGNINTPADIDYVCQLPAYAFLAAHCAVSCSPNQADYLDDSNEDEFTPIYACRKGQLYNIICVGSSVKFEAWKTTTYIMRTLSNNPQLQDAVKLKWKRVRLFRALCDVLEPVEPLYEERNEKEALHYDKCKVCGREAVNFTNKSAKDFYKATAVCERCQVRA